VHRLAAVVFAPLCFVFASCGEKGEQPHADPPPLTEAERADLLGASEELILELTPRLAGLARGLLEHEVLPTGEVRPLFAMSVGLQGELDSPGDARTNFSVPGVRSIPWLLAEGTSTRGNADLVLWVPLLKELDALGEARFFIVDGKFTDRHKIRFETIVGFDGTGWLKDETPCWIAAKQKLTWSREDAGWRISSWKQKELSVTTTPAPLFREVLRSAVSDADHYQRARESHHEQHIIELFTKNRFQVRTDNKLYAKYPDLEGLFQHPAVSVVDIDSDGFDDLYVMGRWGRNLLLRNGGDGTFEDIAGRVGLDLEGFCNCALFADFDNDGDQDVFIGRGLERAIYLVNEEGKFVERTRERIGTLLPYLVSTISATDYNGDGLLDVYLGLYGPSTRAHSVESWAADFFPPIMVEAMLKREKDSHRYLERFGPPNLLLAGRANGAFRVAPEAEQLAEWLNTFQCSWADFDNDGDADAYVCNDFGPDHLYRNDGPRKEGSSVIQFSEVSKEVAGDSMQGFGMGASWGDYDNDGRLDLYVSNMFSKAGRRITATFAGLDPRLPYFAEGSLLFHNRGDRLVQVAGTSAGSMQVAKVGWSWGGQFADFDNDGWLDIYAPSGFYTAPEELRPEKDL
jgi:hypothetical protein